MPHVRTSFDILRAFANLGGTSTVPKMHDQNDAYADHVRIKGLGHSFFRMSKVHVYPRHHRRHRSDDIGIGRLAKCRFERTEVRPIVVGRTLTQRMGRLVLAPNGLAAIVRGLCSKLARFLQVDEHPSGRASKWMSIEIPVLLVGKTGNETGRAALIIFELRHGFQLILGGVKDRVIRIPLLVGSPNRPRRRGGSTCRGCRRSVRCRSCVAVDIFCG
jgi:hypothetical protein